MENNKYYVPQIEDIKLGFRHERRDIYGVWSKKEVNAIYEISALSLMLKDVYMNGSPVRVKLLDTEDIQELGWEIDSPYSFRKREYILEVGLLDLHRGLDTLDIYLVDKLIFQGTIKNYNELKDIMKMLNIE